MTRNARGPKQTERETTRKNRNTKTNTKRNTQEDNQAADRREKRRERESKHHRTPGEPLLTELTHTFNRATKNGLSCFCGINAVVPPSMHYPMHCTSACAACRQTAPLANAMFDTLLLQPLLAMIVLCLVSPTSVVSWSMQVSIPIGNLLAPDAAPPATLISSLSEE